MKRICLVALSAATVTATMALAMDDASAQRRGGVNRAGVHAGGINRVGVNRVGVNRIGVNRAGVYGRGVNRAGIAYRPGLVAGNRVGWDGNRNNWNRRGWGVAGASLALAATAAAYNPGNYYDSSYYLTRADYIGSYRTSGGQFGYSGPVCSPWVDTLCQ